MKVALQLRGLAVLACSLGLSLSGCSDSPSAIEAPAAINAVPASATTSSKAYTQFAATLSNSESATPLEVNTVQPPTSETDPPQMI